MMRHKSKGTKVYYAAPAGTDENHNREIQKNIDIDLQLNGVLNYQGNIISDTATQFVKSRQDAYEYYESIVGQMSKKGKLTSRQIGNVIDCLLSKEQYAECIGATVFYLHGKRKQLEQHRK